MQISLTVAGPTRKLTEGSDVQFLCLAKANPSEVTYRWFVNDQFAQGESTSELWLINVTRRLHNSFVRCEVQNSVDKAEESKALSILCEHNNIFILHYEIEKRNTPNAFGELMYDPEKLKIPKACVAS